MNSHDKIMELAKQRELIERLTPAFNDLTMDLTELMEKADDPVVLAAVMFKLAEERRKTNEILSKINEKFDAIMFEVKNPRTSSKEVNEVRLNNFEILPEQDRRILSLVEEKGSINALEVKNAMGYKGLNAASQRLSKLHRENFLKKIRSGKTVLYLPKI